MLVDVLQLRRHGIKLPTDALGAPMRGWLRVHGTNIDDAVSTWADLYTNTSPSARPFIPGLRDAVLTRLDHRGFVIKGLQRDPMQPEQPTAYPQAWFCKPVEAGA